MAAGLAAGEYLQPMVIFQGQHAQSTWKPNIQNEQLYSWMQLNKSGWMDSETFCKCFEEFGKENKRSAFKGIQRINF